MKNTICNYILCKCTITAGFIVAVLLVSCSVSKQINRQVNNILLKDSVINTGHTGISIYEPASNTYWYNYHADKYFVPASNVKLFTLYAGMKYLGDSLVVAKVDKDANGNIYVLPAADPTFLNSEYKNH
jgi:serine-type D-Ala-D-Ala carboxypeptidase/endopeptidase (penicillin-binding protein 4)